MRSLLLISMLLACQAEPVNTFVPAANRSEAPIKDAEQSVGEPIAITTEAIPDPPKPKVILLIGDSEVMYMDWFFSRAHVKQPNETVLFDSKPGTTIGTWNFIFVSEMARYQKVDEVLIFLGTNNFNFPFLQNHDNILNEVKRRKVKCLWIGPTKVYGKHHPINEMIKQAVEPTCTFFNTEEDGIELQDGVHPTLAGGIKWLKDIWSVK